MEKTGWYPESPNFKHQRRPSRPEPKYTPPTTLGTMDPPEPAEILNPAPPTEKPQPDTQPQAPAETPRAPMEPKKIRSDLDGDYWRSAEEPPTISGRRLRSRTIPVADATHQVNCLGQIPQINYGDKAWIPWTDDVNVEEIFFVDLRDTDILGSCHTMQLDD